MKIKLFVPKVVEIPDEKVPEIVKNFYIRHWNEEWDEVQEPTVNDIDLDDLIIEAVDAEIIEPLMDGFVNPEIVHVSRPRTH
jgi:hypothetical protein